MGFKVKITKRQLRNIIREQARHAYQFADPEQVDPEQAAKRDAGPKMAMDEDLERLLPNSLDLIKTLRRLTKHGVTIEARIVGTEQALIDFYEDLRDDGDKDNRVKHQSLTKIMKLMYPA